MNSVGFVLVTGRITTKKTGGFYNCNRFKPDELKMKTTENVKLAMEKYMHYYSRYVNHERSRKFESKLRDSASTKIRELQRKDQSTSWSDVEFIQKAVEVLIDCRSALKYTYVFAYYLADGSQKELFEYLQQQLERITESLSEILEAPVEKFDRTKIMSTSNSARKRLGHLTEGVEDGLSSNNVSTTISNSSSTFSSSTTK